MKKFLPLLFIFLSIQIVSAQKTTWKGYFSYNQIQDFSESPTTLYAASQNALFTKNAVTGDLKIYNTLDGLSGQTISAMYHSEDTKKTIFGYTNGLLVVRNEVDGSVINVVDIISKNIPQNIKKVNHFIENNGLVYISCDFGIVLYNLNNNQFGDTYYIGNGGGQIKINQTAIFNNRIYAATQDFGIRSASISNPNLIDYNQWTMDIGFNWKGIQKFNDKLVAITPSGDLYQLVGSTFSQVTNYSQVTNDFRVSNNYLTYTTPINVYVFQSNFTQLLSVNTSQIPETGIVFTKATVIDDQLYIGTQSNGVYTCPLNNTSSFENILPDGPFRNYIFSMKKSANSLWATYGGYDKAYNPYGFLNVGISQFPISKYTSENGWKTIPYSDLLGAKSITNIAISPTNENLVYATSFFNGLLKIENDVPTTLLDYTNTGVNGLSSFLTDVIRLNAPTFDKNSSLWLGNCRVDKPIKTLKSNGTWLSYSLLPPIDNDYSSIQIDKNNTKWIGTYRKGVYAFNEAGNKVINVTDISNTQHPDLNDVRAVAIDKRNQVWIGTARGLRVVSSVDSFLNSNEVTSNSVIILEDGLAQELLFEQFILDIVVDGANNKWIATNSAGVFQFSSDGQKTLQHFTTTNSPLPSNNVLDIEIDDNTGEVFFATDSGLVSYNGSATGAKDNLDDVFIYPNPVRPEYEGTVKISGLLDKATVKITDITGNLVYEDTSEGGTIEWDTTAFGKYKVASGVYMVFISAQDGIETKVKKVMIVR